MIPLLGLVRFSPAQKSEILEISDFFPAARRFNQQAA
jgi:hypothetical protein